MQSEQIQAESIATAYRRSCVLFAAIELGIWQYFESRPAPASIGQLAEFTNLHETKVLGLVNCLVQMKILEMDADRRLSSPVIEALGAHDARSALLNYKDELKEWLGLSRRMASGEAGDRESHTFSSSSIGPYLDMVKMSNAVRAANYTKVLVERLGRVERFLDLGGGHGLYTQLLLETYPEATGVVLDLPVSIGYLKENFPKALSNRLKMVEGDAREAIDDGPFDLIMVNDLLHSFSFEDKEKIISNAATALRVDGRLLVGKFHLDQDDPGSPLNNHLFSLKMMLNTKDGYLESNQDVVEMLRANGLTDIQVVEVPHDIPSVAVFSLKG